MSIENKKIEEVSDDIRTRVYEAGVLLIAGLGDEGAVQYVKTLQDWVTERGGEIIAEGAPERFDLAYPMSQIRDNKRVNHFEAYLTWFKFTLNTALVRTFEDNLSRDLNVIRKLVFKTVREATYVQRKSPRRSTNQNTEEPPTELPDEPVVGMEDETIESGLEKKLEELVITE
jgi:ribosomal protein S6